MSDRSLPSLGAVRPLPARDEEWVSRPAVARTGEMLRRLMAAFLDPAVGVPALLFAAILVACFVVPAVFPIPNPNSGSLVDHLLPIASRGHPLGTNELGNDMLSRLLYGGRVSLVVGLLATAIGFVVGTLLGTIAGFQRGLVDVAVMRVVDTIFAFPGLILALVIAAYLGPSEMHTVWAIAFFSIAGFARLGRAQTVRVRNHDYLVAARMTGSRPWRTILTHILPNVMPPLLTYALFSVGIAMVVEAGLSYLGLGIQVPNPSWGNIIRSGQDSWATAPQLVIMPSALLFLTVLSLNLMADGLRRRLAVDSL